MLQRLADRGTLPLREAITILRDVAYVRDVEVDGATAFGIFAANGQQLAILPDRETAEAAVWENGLAPVTIH